MLIVSIVRIYEVYFMDTYLGRALYGIYIYMFIKERLLQNPPIF